MISATRNGRFWHWPRFSIRWLFVLVTLVAVALGYHVHLTQHQHAAVAQITKLGGRVEYTFILPQSLTRFVQIEWIGYISHVSLFKPLAHLALRDLQKLPTLRSLEILCDDDVEATSQSLFATSMRESLPGVAVSYSTADLFETLKLYITNNSWTSAVLGLPSELEDGDIQLFSLNTTCVRSHEGELLYVTAVDGVAMLMNGNQAVDWKKCPMGPHSGPVEITIDDADGDGRPDVTFRVELRATDGTEPRRNHKPQRISAYSIHSDALREIPKD